MKKTLKTLSLIIAFGGLSLSAIAMGTSGGILDLLTMNEAEAKCCPTSINNGRCSYAKNCFPDAGGQSNDCDSTSGTCDEEGEIIR